jgi:Mrp family chromosome partitioning ATPase/capsular polysaccharide biosynthesis protein
MQAIEFKASPARSLRPGVAWQRYRSVGIIVALAVLLIGIPLALLTVKSSYSAEAVFQVSPSYQKTMSADKDLELQSNSQYREFVNHLSRSLLRYDVLERALTTLSAKGIDPRLPSEDTRKCIERLQKTIYVFAIPDTYMVRAGMRSDSKENLHQIVNAVMDSFLETTRNEQIYGSDERGHVLAERAAAVRSEIADFESRRAELASFLSLTTFGDGTINPFDAILAQARERLAQAALERSRAQSTLSAFEHQKEVPAASGRSVLEMRLQDNGLQAMRNEVIKRNEELIRIVSGLQDGHPAKKPALDEMAELKRRLQLIEADFDKSSMGNTRSRFAATLEQAQQVERELAERVTELQSQATEFATRFREAMRYTGEIKKREQELTDMRARTNYLETESSAFGFTRLITPALPAITPQGIGKTKILLGLLLASLALMLVIPLAMDFLDKRVITVGDAEKAMQIPSAAWLVDACDAATHILIDDQLRRFASTLRRNQARGARNVYSFSSVKVGGGTTSTVLELARTLVELGSRTLVVDADSLTSDSALSSDAPGLTDLMVGKTTAQAAITRQQHFGMQLNVVPYGRSTDSGIKRLDVLKAALQTWSEQFDMVLIDLPPLLPSADAELLIDAIGQVFLVVEAEVLTKADVVRARVQLERMDPDAVGLIVNKVPMESGGESIKSQLVETITGGKFNTFMSSSGMGLRWNLLLLKLQRIRQGRHQE